MILGRQGAGKGTQSARLADRLDVDHISTGDLFRAAVASGSALGRRVQAILDAGDLVPDQVVLEVVAQRLLRARAEGRGYLLDGFPRTVAQADLLFGALGPDACDLAVELHVPTEAVLPRLAARRVCGGCGRNYVADDPAVESWTCPHCGGEVARRADDTDEAIRRRLALYDEETGPLLVWLHSKGLLVSVDGEGSPEEVHERVVAAVQDRLRALVDAR